MKRNKFRILVLSLISVCGLLLLTGCGKRAALAADPAPFQQAVHAYLADKSMDMKVAEFKTLTVTGDQAEAEIALEQAEGAAGVKVRWKFWFDRKNNVWTVLRHQQ